MEPLLTILSIPMRVSSRGEDGSIDQLGGRLGGVTSWAVSTIPGEAT
jgi:hypothetical protein